MQNSLQRRNRPVTTSRKKEPAASGLARPRLLFAFAAILLVAVGVIVAVLWRGSSTGASETIEYITEKGADTNEGVVNSPLTVRLRVPGSVTSPESALAGVSLELLDEAGNRATFGGVEFPPLSMVITDEQDVWAYEGSVPGKAGSYSARVLVTPLYNSAVGRTIVFSEPRLRALPEEGAPLVSGYVFSLGPDLWLLSTDGSKRRRLTFFTEATRYPDEPAWSPDGKRIAFAYQAATPPTELPLSDIWVLAPDGSGAKLLVEHGPREVLADPAWSRDGKYLYFAVDTLPDAVTSSGKPRPEDRRIDQLDLATLERKPYALASQRPATLASSDGLLVVEDTPAPDVGGTPGQQLSLVGSDGSRQAVLVGPGRYPQIYAPRMSPNGKWVVFSAPNGRPGTKDGAGLLEWLLFLPQVASAHEIPWDLFIVSSAGRVEQLTSMDEDQPHLTWLDDRTLAFIGETGLYMLTVSDGGKPVGEPRKIHIGGQHSTLTWRGP